MNYLIFDNAYNTFRIESATGENGLVDLAVDISEYTMSDEEPYSEPITCLSEAKDFLELYNYTVVAIDDAQLELFESYTFKYDNDNNRLTEAGSKLFMEEAKVKIPFI